jgi:hypothetical protein
MVHRWGGGCGGRANNLPQLYFHTGGDLHDGVSELMASCACRSFRSAAWSSRRSLDLARSVSRCVAGVHWRWGRGDFSGARMLVRRWLICHSLRLHRWEAVDLGPRQHEDVPRSTCHNDMCLHRLIKPRW